MQALSFLFGTLISLFSFLFIFRAWFQFAKIDYHFPLSQFIARYTNPIVRPLSTLLPTFKGVNFAALFIVFLLGFIKLPLLTLYFESAGILDYLILGFLHILSSFGLSLIYVLFFGAILSWFNNNGNPLQIIAYQLTEPFLKPIRRILPSTGMLDFSPMVLVFILLFINQLLAEYIYLWRFA